MRPVILCGGNGSRLWPLSQPKQFQKIFSHNTMLQNTLLRLKGVHMPPIITTNIQYESLIMEELKLLQDYKVIFEPIKLGTAAAILIAALLCNENEIMLILPSDHFIDNLDNFYTSIRKASQIACEADAIVTFGIKPNEFNSEYGYMHVFYEKNKKYYTVKDFIEKPTHELGDNYYWNSGIFVFKAKRYIDELKRSALHLYNLCNASMKKFSLNEKFLYLKHENFEGIEGLSADHLVMGKAKNIAMIKADFEWKDVGTWSAILELSNKFNKEPPSFIESNKLNNITNNVEPLPNKSLASFINKIKQVKAMIKREIRPWGFYSTILTNENFLVKYLFINPLSCTSNQIHRFRDEHHIVLSGIGHITLEDKIHIVEKNHAIEAPRNISHRIENKSKSCPLEVLEFQVGEYLSDSDIVRLDDIYGRV